MKKCLLFLLPLLLLTSCNSQVGLTVDEANTIVQGFKDANVTTYSYSGEIYYIGETREISGSDKDISANQSETISAPLILDKENFLNQYSRTLQYCLISSDSYQKVIIEELDTGITFYSLKSNISLQIKHASSSDSKAEVNARWNISLIYNDEGLLVEEVGETTNFDTNDLTKAAFRCTYTYA